MWLRLSYKVPIGGWLDIYNNRLRNISDVFFYLKLSRMDELT